MSTKQKPKSAWRKALGDILRQRIMQRVMEISIKDQTDKKRMHQMESNLVDISAGKDDETFRNAKKQAFVDQAMEYFENPIFKRMVMKDLQEQEKYFDSEPPPVPAEWLREGLSISNSLKSTSQFAVDKMENIPGHIVQKIQEEYEFFKNGNEENQHAEVQQTNIWVSRIVCFSLQC